jgi:putative ABC transport system permease protein
VSYALATLWFDRQRYLPGILAVAFSALLIALQCGLLFGLLSVTSIPIDRSDADVWIGSTKVLSVDTGLKPVSEGRMRARIGALPGVLKVESYIQKFCVWDMPSGGSDLCIVMGCWLGDDAIGPVLALDPDLRDRLVEDGAVVVDESELERLDIRDAAEQIADGGGAQAKINGKTVRIVGLVKGMKSIAGPYVFCSLQTARRLCNFGNDQTVYMLAKCENPRDAEAVVRMLQEDYVNTEYADMSVFTKREFSMRSRMHWLTKTKAGLALGYAAFLGLIVGAVVTSQTLYAATMASMREYAILLALGIPRWRLRRTVLTQAFWIGVFGVIVSVPATMVMAELASQLGVRPQLSPELIVGAAVVTLVMSVLSGLIALRSLNQIEPVNLLR